MGDGVYIAIPNTGTVRAELAKRICDIVATSKRKVGFNTVKNVPHDCSRNVIVKDFLDNPNLSGADWLLMIDSDIVPPLNILDMTLADKDVTTAFCRVKRNDDGVSRDIPVCLYRESEGQDYEYDPSRMTGDLQKCDAVGTGCILIHRRVLVKMREAMKDWPSEKKGWFRFIYDEEGKMVKGEDLDFSEKARELGFEIWFDSRFRCLHFTTAII